MPKKSITEARVRMLKPRRTVREVRDGKLRGFGVRVLPSGKKHYFIHCQYAGERIWKTIGGAETMTAGEARFRASELLIAIRSGKGLPPEPGETLFETIAETVFRRHERVWKAGTLAVNRSYLQSQLLPYFAGRQIADIDRQDVRNWFASLSTTPASANRSMPVLSKIMREAERMGLRPRDSNPCRGIRRYPRNARERFLTDDEIRRLSARLYAHEGRCPLQVSAVRLLLLTGCRKGEILSLRWTDYRDGHLFLRDSKTGPRTVWLSQPARDILDRIKRAGRWVFLAPRKRGPRCNVWLDGFWQQVRAEAELDDVRLHDLRHTHASLALRQGETVLAIARLLGHGSAVTTLKYAHPADPMAKQAIEALGGILEG